MTKPYRDKTCATAVANSNKEWRDMARLALILRKGNMPMDWVDLKTPLFTGIFKRLLTDPIDEVQREVYS